ncbi:DUF2214 family protein [Ideonella sp. DXS29W]|uniref:DUF2214 family protein n=1 Tax=Ideonella lacteola TaxID=2984193 RepID=A0ABU9BS52_9BURK
MSPLALDAALAVLHHALVFTLVALLAAELAIASGPVGMRRLAQLGRVDAVYGLMSLGVVAAGFLRAVYGAKGWAYYAHQPMFWLKIGLFVVVGLLSAVPTVRLIRWRRDGSVPSDEAVRALRRWMWGEAAVMALMPFAAALMARGIGL